MICIITPIITADPINIGKLCMYIVYVHWIQFGYLCTLYTNSASTFRLSIKGETAKGNYEFCLTRQFLIFFDKTKNCSVKAYWAKHRPHHTDLACWPDIGQHQHCSMTMTPPWFHCALHCLLFPEPFIRWYCCPVFYVTLVMTRFENEVKSYCKTRMNLKVVKWG